MAEKVIKFKFSFFEIFTALWLLIVFFSLLTALVGIFYSGLILFLTTISLGSSFVFLQKRGIKIIKHSKDEIFVFLLVFVWSVFLFWGTFPTIFGGRDEGSFSNAAILLSRNHTLFHQDQLTRDFFQIYGPGKALNFPGFYYTSSGELRSQFLPGYISYLAFLFDWGGLDFLSFSNFIPLVLFLFAFYLLAKKLFALLFKRLLFENDSQAKNRQALSWAFLAFPFILLAPTLIYLFDANISLDHPWMLRRFIFSILPFSVLASFLILIWLIAAILSQKRIIKDLRQNQLELLAQSCSFLALLFLASFFPLALFSRFTLSEIFFAALLWSLVYFSFNYFLEKRKEFLFFIFILIFILPFVRIESLAVIFVLMIFFLLLDHQNFQKASFQFFVALAAFFVFLSLVFNSNFFIDSFKNLLGIGNYFNNDLAKSGFGARFIPDDWEGGYLWKVLSNYNLLEPILAGFLGLIWLFLVFKKRNWQEGKIFRNNSKLANGIAFLAAIAFLARAAFLVFDNAELLRNIFYQNQNLWKETQLLSEKFDSDDLILVSQKSSGSGWTLISEPLRNILGKKAVYFFNPNDLEKIDLSHYGRIFLITAESEKDLFEKIPKRELEKYQLENILIEPTKDPWKNPEIKRIITKGAIYEILR